MVEVDEFVKIIVNVPLPLADARDPRRRYKKARQKMLPRFTGIDSPHEVPEFAEWRPDTW